MIVPIINIINPDHIFRWSVSDRTELALIVCWSSSVSLLLFFSPSPPHSQVVEEGKRSKHKQYECCERRTHAEQNARPEELVEEPAGQVPERHAEPEVEPVKQALCTNI